MLSLTRGITQTKVNIYTSDPSTSLQSQSENVLFFPVNSKDRGKIKNSVGIRLQICSQTQFLPEPEYYKGLKTTSFKIPIL